MAIFRFSFPTASPVQQPSIINHLFKAPGCGIISPLFAAFCKKILVNTPYVHCLGGWNRPLVERCISALCEVTGLTQSCRCFNMLLVAKTCFFRKSDKSKGLNVGLVLFLWRSIIISKRWTFKKWSDCVTVAAVRRGALGSRTIYLLFVFAELLKKGKPAAKHFPTLGAFLSKPRRSLETL